MTFESHGGLSWVSLEKGAAELMLALGDSPTDPASQAVPFYLYAADRVGLRARLDGDGWRPAAGRPAGPAPASRVVRKPPG